MWDLPGPGIKPISPALRGIFFTIGPLRKSHLLLFWNAVPLAYFSDTMAICSGGFPGDLVVKNMPANAGDKGDLGSIPGLGRYPVAGNGNLLPYSCLKNSMDRGAWRAPVRGAAESQTQLSTHGLSSNSSHCVTLDPQNLLILQLKFCTLLPTPHYFPHPQKTLFLFLRF